MPLVGSSGTRPITIATTSGPHVVEAYGEVATIPIRTPCGWIGVEAIVYGTWAVHPVVGSHPDRDIWSVTHRATGMKLPFPEERGGTWDSMRARWVATALDAQVYGVTPDEIIAQGKRIREICGEVERDSEALS